MKKAKMKAKISPFKSCLLNAVNRSKVFIFIYSLYALLCAILGILLSLSQVNPYFMDLNSPLQRIFTLLSEIDIAGLVLGLVSAVYLFSKYLTYRSDNLIRSLPAENKHLFWADFTVGAAMFAVPNFIGMAIQSAVGITVKHSSADEVFNALGVSHGLILNYIFGFCAAVLCFSLMTGVLEGVITFLIVNFIPSIISSFISFGKTCVLGAFKTDEIVTGINIKTTFDILVGSSLGRSKITYLDALRASVIVILICAAGSLAAYFIFNRMRAQGGANKKLKNVLTSAALCLISFYCGFLVLFFKRRAVNLFSGMIIIPSMLIISFIIFYLASAAAAKNPRLTRRKFLPYLAVPCMLTLIGAVYFTGGFGAAEYVPPISDISSVTINYADDKYKSQVDQKKLTMFSDDRFLAQYDIDVKFPITYSYKGGIVAVCDYHRALIKEYKQHGLIETEPQENENFKSTDGGTVRTEITYTLKNGKTVRRYYNYNGGDDTVNRLRRLRQYDNSVEQIQTRALSYIESAADDSVTHNVYVTPLIPEYDGDIFNISDSQMQQLVKAIYDDEQAMSNGGETDSDSGDICTLLISPRRDDDYFDSVFKSSRMGFSLAVKPNYKNTVSFIKNELNAEKSLENATYKAKQILAMSADEFGKLNYLFGDRFEYDSTKIYAFDYYGSVRIYNSDAVDNSNIDDSDGRICDSKSLDFLASRSKLCCKLKSGDIIYITSKSVVSAISGETASGTPVLCVSQSDWNTFLNMCKQLPR